MKLWSWKLRTVDLEEFLFADDMEFNAERRKTMAIEIEERQHRIKFGEKVVQQVKSSTWT